MPAAPTVTAEKPAQELRVWDAPTRLFHWLTVAAVAVAALTGYFGPAWMLSIHAWAGYLLAVLVVFRLIWAFFGSEFSRLDRLEAAPHAVIAHLRGLLSGRGTHRIGHTPAGSAMIIAVIAVLLAILVTGLVTLGGQEKQGVLAGVMPYSIGHAARRIHEFLTIVLLIMVAVHVVAVVADSVWGPANLITAMITGRKRAAYEAGASSWRQAQPFAASATLGAVGAFAVVGGGMLSRLPPLGIYDMKPDPTYEAECGACHYDFHPSLLPASSWTGIMAHLDDHFGEDASLDPDTRDHITAWLVANSSEHWDTEAANSFRHVLAADPLRITATRYWKWRHQNIPEAVYSSKPVGSKVNCVACHHDARTGRFDDQSIDVPEDRET
jgi:cytochrome b